jgi:hypothetical protein
MKHVKEIRHPVVLAEFRVIFINFVICSIVRCALGLPLGWGSCTNCITCSTTVEQNSLLFIYPILFISNAISKYACPPDHLGALVKVDAKWGSRNYEERWIGFLCSNKYPVHKNKGKCELDERNGRRQITPCFPPKILIWNCQCQISFTNKFPKIKIMLDLVTWRSYGRRLGEALCHGVTSNRLAASSVETWAVLGYR